MHLSVSQNATRQNTQRNCQSTNPPINAFHRSVISKDKVFDNPSAKLAHLVSDRRRWPQQFGIRLTRL
jgi:hypothetical protein